MGVLLQPQSWHINVFLTCGPTSTTQPVLLTIFLIKRHEIWCGPNANHTLWAEQRVRFSPSPWASCALYSWRLRNIFHFRMSEPWNMDLKWTSLSEARVQSLGHRVFIKPHLGMSLQSWSTGEMQWEGNVTEWCRDSTKEYWGAGSQNWGKNKFRGSCFCVRVPR